MPDPRFARLKTDPRFRRPKRKEAKVVVDDRFKSIFDDGKGKKGKSSKKGGGRVDKYGRPVSDNQEGENLRRFYRLDDEEEAQASKGPDYARGEVLLESSDEEESDDPEVEDSDDGKIVTLGKDPHKPIRVPEVDDEAEIDLDEDDFVDLDAQAAAYAKSQADEDRGAEINPTRRLAVVNLDWDHVRAIHLYKIFSSLVSPTANISGESSRKGSGSGVVKGKVLSVRVYPSQFGKERMAREEKEGPPAELFKRNEEEEEINEKNIIEVGEGNDYDEDALRKYQLERLRYYYAIVECDAVSAASHIYTELEGTELEYSANVFDLSYVPDDMTFDDEHRDEATEEVMGSFKGLDFVTDALRHSKVKLTWDEDDPERNRITRRTLSRKEIDEADFKAYLASSTSGSDSESENNVTKKGAKAKVAAERDKLRALLLGGGSDQMPEGWGMDKDDTGDVDMEITFTPGLSEAKSNDADETTLEKYQRKMKQKRKKRKEELKEKPVDGDTVGDGKKDEFFDFGSEEGDADHLDEPPAASKGGKRDKGKGKGKGSDEQHPRHLSTPEELALLAGSDNPFGEVKHFDMKAVIKAEKSKGNRKKGKKKGVVNVEESELQEDFKLDVKDDRFTALHEDHTFAIDPSNPHFKKTKGMSALLEERSKRRKGQHDDGRPRSAKKDSEGGKDLQNLVERVKRKSASISDQGTGKRRKV
ncbi:hypothetical protein JAAARDRAFT_381668 [Jaapia argillacea MUCL 33604]|uniref:Uncharacterized protein n=1 Tax=Jaapia argillacea MUCL 33604 TaxID=933084 RepID=A0A067QBJ8_9AGAM|nr:hypothetical protein JAAARDRAFT_381668 [Jaapia argillacea MUCL 33604]